MLSLPRKLIPKITIYLTPVNIANLSYSCSKFGNVFDFNWRRYFRYHFGLDIGIGKTIAINYSKMFFGKVNQLQSRPFEFSSAYLEYLLFDRSSIITEIVNKISWLRRKIIDKYQHNSLYQKLIKIHRPVFIGKKDFIKYGMLSFDDPQKIFVKVKINKLLEDHIDRIIITKKNFIYDSYENPFLECVNNFSDRILLIRI